MNGNNFNLPYVLLSIRRYGQIKRDTIIQY